MLRDGSVRLFYIILFLLLSAPVLRAQSFSPKGNLDCNGYSQIQKPLKSSYLPCTDFYLWGGRGYDNSHYIGHDEPSVGFFSNVPGSGNNMQWDITLPTSRPLPAVQTFQLTIAPWFAMAICDPNSFPGGACIPDSDENTPSLAGSAVLELQFYPPGWPPFITQISCDATHYCAALNIDSLELETSAGPMPGQINPGCSEPVNFAFIQTNGVPAGPPGPATATEATFTPNSQTFFMNPGDHLHLTIKDTANGLLTRIDDLSTGQSGFMVASGANGFQNTDPDTCTGANFDFHPEFSTARFGNFVPWAALQANINMAVEIGHFETPDGDSDDPPCFPGPHIPGCLGADLDFDGNSYQFDWPNGSPALGTPLTIRSVKGGGIGPLSVNNRSGDYDQVYPIIQLETDVPASETTCQSNGVGCVVPPVGAQFYPFYAVTNDFSTFTCALVFGNFNGLGVDNFGGDAGWGTSNLPWFFGTNSSGPRANPCIPQPFF
jgi:hypothetical protein